MRWDKHSCRTITPHFVGITQRYFVQGDQDRLLCEVMTTISTDLVTVPAQVRVLHLGYFGSEASCGIDNEVQETAPFAATHLFSNSLSINLAFWTDTSFHVHPLLIPCHFNSQGTIPT